jgi:hypothetical protein
MKNLVITWREGLSKGYSDVFPLRAILVAQANPTLTHSVRGPKGGVLFARCKVVPREKMVDLDYTGDNTEYNKNRNMLLGVLRLKLSRVTRGAVDEVLWRDKGRQKFSTVDVTAALESPRVDPYEDTEGN